MLRHSDFYVGMQEGGVLWLKAALNDFHTSIRSRWTSSSSSPRQSVRNHPEISSGSHLMNPESQTKAFGVFFWGLREGPFKTVSQVFAHFYD